MANLVAIAVDECHLIWDWKDFRVLYAALGRLRQSCKDIPWVCLSATLTPGAEAFVHEVCKLMPQTLRVSVTIRRQNISLNVAPINLPGFEELFALLPSDVTSPADIPKTLVFVDSVTQAIQIARALRAKLRELVRQNLPIESRRRMRIDTLIGTYFSATDDVAKSQALSNIRDGCSRICVCTEAFGLGVNIPDILRVIQWGVTTRLNSASLFQRAGRAARDPIYRGLAIVYVQQAIMKVLAKVAPDPNVVVPAEVDDGWGTDELELADEEPRVIPVSKQRQLHKFLLSVEDHNYSEVNALVRELYTAATSLRNANREAQREGKGTRSAPTDTIRKIDPGVLWVIATQGCKWRAFLSLFKDSEALQAGLRRDTPDTWCCSTCALACDIEPATSMHGIELSASAVYQKANPDLVGKNTRRQVRVYCEVPDRSRLLCSERGDMLRKVLHEWRDVAFECMELPKSLIPSVIMSDSIIEHIVTHAHRIVTVERLCEELAKAKMDVESSLLSDSYLANMVGRIDKTLEVAYAPIQPGTFPHAPILTALCAVWMNESAMVGSVFMHAPYAENTEFCFVTYDPSAPSEPLSRSTRLPGTAPFSNQTNINNLPPAPSVLPRSPKQILDKSALRPMQVIERMNAQREGTKKRKITPSWKFSLDH
jgi:hypothetical protein